MCSVNGSLRVPQLITLGLIAMSLTACQSDADAGTCNIVFSNGAMLANMPLAITTAQKSKGLQHNADPAPGMVFTWEKPATPEFWMKDTPAALDAAFVSPDGVIIHTASMEPNSETLHYAREPVIAVVEVPAGNLDALEISTGSQVETTSCW